MRSGAADVEAHLNLKRYEYNGSGIVVLRGIFFSNGLNAVDLDWSDFFSEKKLRALMDAREGLAITGECPAYANHERFRPLGHVAPRRGRAVR